MEKRKRPTWDELCMKIAFVASEKSSCLRRQVGAVLLTKDKRIISVGWNGAPSNHKHCDELGGCLREKLKITSGQRHEICRAVHAEQNVIIASAMYGASSKDTILYVTNFPCLICAKILVQAKVAEIVYSDIYGDEEQYPESLRILLETGITIKKIKFNKEKKEIEPKPI